MQTKNTQGAPLSVAPVAAPPPLRQPTFLGVIGVARCDITPPVGIYARNWGAAKHDVAEGIHRPMTLTALTLQESPTAPPLVLIAADLCWWREEATERSVREPILAALKLDPSRLIFNLSHTHSGPALSPDFAKLSGGDKIAPYLELLRTEALKAVKTALADARPATLDWTYGRCNLATNRDLADPAAPADKPRVVCGFNPAKKADDTVLIGRVVANEPTPKPGKFASPVARAQAGATGGAGAAAQPPLMATIVNYACHPVTLAWENRLISPDYVGAMREVIELETGAPCLFLQGASGELAPAREYSGDTRLPDQHGRQLGHAVLSALVGMLPPLCELAFEHVIESGAPLAAWQVRPWFRPGVDDARAPVCRLQAVRTENAYQIKSEYPPVAEIQRQLAQAARADDRVLSERLRRKLAVRMSLGDGTHTNFHHWLWQVGDALVAGIPHEAYSDLQLALRERFAPNAVVVMNLVNGSTGYLPPRGLYSQDLYQVWQSPFAAGCLEMVIEACGAGLSQLQHREFSKAL